MDFHEIWNFRGFFENLSRKFKFHYNMTRITGTLHEDVCTFMIMKVKWSRDRPGVAQRVGRGIALLFHNRGTRRGWVVSSTPRPHFTHGKDPVPILQEAGWAPGPVWTGGKSRSHRDSIPDRSQSLYRLSYPAHTFWYLAEFFLEWEIFQTKLYRQNTRVMFNNGVSS